MGVGGDEGDEVPDPLRPERLEEFFGKKILFSSTLCHYAGEKETRYRNAIRNEAAPQNIEVKTVSVEKAKGDDLLADQPYTTHLRWVK